MNIAYLHTGYFPSHSPSFTFATMNAMALASVFDFCHFFIKRKQAKCPKEVIFSWFDLEMPAGLSVHAYRDILGKATHRYYVKIVSRKVIQMVKKEQIDVVIARHPLFLPLLSTLRARFGIPVFYESHDFFADLSLREDVNPRKKRRLEKLERKFIPHLSGVFCLQESQKKYYQKVFPHQRMEVVRTGLWQVYGDSPRAPRFLTYIGSFDSHKGIDVLLEAVAYSRISPPLLLMGGKDKKDIACIERKVRALKKPVQITITGWMDRKRMKEYLLQTAVGVLPLQNTFFNRNLTSPLKLFDYYSLGIPVIASELPTMRELIKENQTGVFFEPGNPIALAEKIDYFFSHSENWPVWNRRVLEHAQHWTWEKRAEKIQKIVHSVQKTS